MRILYLDIDTLRPDHLGCYGYARNTSPNLDRIAAEGVRFDNCHTSDAPCLPSRSALMTGTFGIHNGVINHDGFNADFRPEGRSRNFIGRMSFDTLPAYLKKEAGLHTVYIGGFGERHSSFDYYAGFREIYDTGKGGMESAEEVTPGALDWLDRNGAGDNWYLHLNYWDPHTPYRVPAEFGNPFAGEPLPEWLTPAVIEQHRAKTVGPHGILDISMYDDRENTQYPRQPGKVLDMDGVRRDIDGYDCGVRYADCHVGMLLDKLEALGVLDELIIIVSSDHGENLGELGLWSEHGTADSITCRIPLIIRWPGMQQGRTDRGLHYHLDLLPTLAELIGKEPRPSWEGESFAAALRDGVPTGRDYLVLSQCSHGCQRSVRWGDWLYMRTYHDFFHLFPKEMLFNLAEDPHEQRDLAPERPELCAEAVHRYLEWHDAMMATQPDGYFHDPLWEVLTQGGPCHSHGKLADYCRRLEATGRGWAVPPLKARHPEEF
ncbi:MAG: sulfatase [Victivallaceae bacterium]